MDTHRHARQQSTGVAAREGDAQQETSPGEPDDSGEDRREEASVGSFLRELPVLLLVAFLLAFLLRTFVVQVFYIPSASMEPTLRIDDRILVEKITYRFRDPQRGEIVVFEGDEPPPAPDVGVVGSIVRGVGQFLGVVPANARDFVKRVVGVPGDVIRIEDGQVFVNEVPIDEPYVVYEDDSDFGPVVVPEDKLFFLGDNRPNSSDSRYPSLGYVDMDRVVGRAVAIIWPPGHLEILEGADYERLISREQSGQVQPRGP